MRASCIFAASVAFVFTALGSQQAFSELSDVEQKALFQHVAAVCKQDSDELALESVARLDEFPISAIAETFFESFYHRLYSELHCREGLVKRALKSQNDYFITIQRAIREGAYLEETAKQLLEAGQPYLSSRSLLMLADAARFNNQPALAALVDTCVVTNARDHPQEFNKIFVDLIVRERTSMLVQIWNRMPEANRSAELLARIIETAAQAGKVNVVMAFQSAFLNAADRSLELSPSTNRLINSHTLSKIYAKKLFDLRVALAPSLLDDEEKASSYREAIAQALSSFILDPANPYFREAQLKMLVTHLAATLPAVELELSSAAIAALCREWSDSHSRYGIPLIITSHI